MIMKSCCVVSGKGGVGKSMLVVALGAMWAAEGKRVALLDMNTGMRGLDMLLGLENRIVFDVGDVLDGICEVQQALVRDTQTGIRLLAARQIADSEALDEEALQLLVETLEGTHDIVLLDACTGIGRGFSAAVQATRAAILVTTPDDQALRDADRTNGLLQRMDMPPAHLVINRIREDLVGEGLQYTPEVCAQVLDIAVRGVIPEDDEALRRSLRKQPVVGDFPAGRAMDNLRARLVDTAVPLLSWQAQEEEDIPPPVEEKKRGRLQRLWRTKEG